MPKRRRANAIVFEKRSSNNNDARNDNPLATVFIDDQRFDSGSSETNSSDSSSESEDNHLSKRSRKSSKKNTCDCRNYYRKLQSQIDLFQRNNDMKLNYIESLLQNLIKANNPPSTSIVSSSNNVNTSVANIKNPIQSSQIKPAISMKRPSVPVDPPQQFDNEADEIIDFDVPKFPIIDIDLLVDFNENLMRSKTLRNDCARRLATIINKSSNTNNFTRIKSLCYKIIHLDVWVTFSFTGRASKYGSPSKNAFKDFVGVLALVHETCNYGKDIGSMMDEIDSKNGVIDAIKRASEKRIQMLSRKESKAKRRNSDEDNISLSKS